jgi:putative membrane protein
VIAPFRVLVTAAALALATALVPGIELQAGTTLSKALTLVMVALVTGIVSLSPRPYARGQGYPFYILVLGAAGLAVNGLLGWSGDPAGRARISA